MNTQWLLLNQTEEEYNITYCKSQPGLNGLNVHLSLPESTLSLPESDLPLIAVLIFFSI